MTTETDPQPTTRPKVEGDYLLLGIATAIAVLLVAIVRSVDIRRTQGTREGRIYQWAQASGRQLLHVFPELTRWAVAFRRWADELKTMTDPLVRDK
jgi:hypothetical protein